MDPISHAVLGASLGYAVFGRKLGRAAAAACGLAAFVPDADIFIRSDSDPLLAVEYHRHFTHSLLFAPFGAAAVAALWFLRERWRAQRFLLWQCCLLGYVSHCLLDAATSYGTQLFWPFGNRRVGWDFISIIDPIFTLSLLVCLIAAVKTQKLRIARIGLAIALAYLAFGGVQHARAAAAQRDLAARRCHKIERVEVMPTMANNVVWRALYLHEGKIHSDRIRVGWFSRATVLEGWALPVVTENDLSTAERARDKRRSFARFNWFSDGWVARKPGDPSVLGDMRYSLSPQEFDPIWGIRFTDVASAHEVEWVNRSRNRKISVRELWDEIVGDAPGYTRLSDAAKFIPENSRDQTTVPAQ
jgi:inner membrane protein